MNMNKKKICITAGLLLWSVGNHCVAYGLLRRIADSVSALSSSLIVVCLYLAGAGLSGRKCIRIRNDRGRQGSSKPDWQTGNEYVIL